MSDSHSAGNPLNRFSGFQFGGLKGGTTFGFSEPFVDKEKPPGRSDIGVELSVANYVLNAILLKHIWQSPNLVWAVIAILFYAFFPYDLSATGAAIQGPLSVAFFKERLPLWVLLVYSYTGFWHVTLYILKWAKRPFVPDRPYPSAKLLHNLFWCTSGVVIWVGFENIMAFLWASGRVAFMPDSELSSGTGLVIFVFGLIATPLWRESHFYWAHRMLHFRPMFTQVHSLHHRNTDVEPFSGLCMHPIEHLYYYACVLPNLVVYASPFHFLFNGVHMLISPAAAHSGFEDHWQADGYHYIHHRYFECNYAGTGAAWLDDLFGTMVVKFRSGDSGKLRADAKSTLAGGPRNEFVVYLLLSGGCVAAFGYVACGPPVSAVVADTVALLAGLGPVLIGCVMGLLKGGGLRGLLSPYDKKPLWESLVHYGVGTMFCVYPIYFACRLAITVVA